MTEWQIGKSGDAEVVKTIRNKNRDEISLIELQFLANRARMNAIEMVYRAKSGHPGGPLGLADIYTYLQFKVLNGSYSDSERDRFLISNGHVCAGRYSIMALAGILEESELATFRALGSKLQGHPSTRYFPEVENSSGSLGQGLSNAGGLALGLRLQNNPGRVFLGMSDGECQEGMTWEAAMAIAHRNVNNLHPFLDWNNIQIDGKVEDVMSLGDLQAKFESFGWEVMVSDGHNFEEIEHAFQWSIKAEKKPRMILFRTVLGKDVSFMENSAAWHGSPPSQEKRDAAISELMQIREKILI